ncbi:MAG: glycosyltransferase, partial [Acidimicrobiia bacterium]
EKLIVEGSRFWDRDRFDYRVAYALPWKDQLVETLRSRDVPVQCFGTKHGMTPTGVYRFWKLCHAWNASLIHAHLPSMGAVARVTSRVPVVYTEHNIASSYRRPVQLVNRATYSRNASVIAVSEAVYESISSYPAPRKQVIPNGVHVQQRDDRAEVRAELGLGVDDRLVVHVGNIRPKKGHRTLVEMAHIVLGQRDDVYIVSVGAEKTAGDLQRLKEAAAERGISDRIVFLGRREDAMRFIAAADVYVNPADVEGLPVTILEALALERPVVATSVGGVPSIIEDNVTGLLVPPADPDALAAGLLRMLDHPDMASALGQRGRNLVESDYGLEAMVRSTESEYSDVLSA